MAVLLRFGDNLEVINCRIFSSLIFYSHTPIYSILYQKFAEISIRSIGFYHMSHSAPEAGFSVFSLRVEQIPSKPFGSPQSGCLQDDPVPVQHQEEGLLL